MRPSQPTLNLARRRLVLREPAACLPAISNRSGSGRCSATGPGSKPPSSAISRGRRPRSSRRRPVVGEQVGFVGRADLGGQREDQAAGPLAGVLAQLGDLHHGPELGRLTQLALADRPGVGVADRDQPIGDLLPGDALGDLLADLSARSASCSRRSAARCLALAPRPRARRATRWPTGAPRAATWRPARRPRRSAATRGLCSARCVRRSSGSACAAWRRSTWSDRSRAARRRRPAAGPLGLGGQHPRGVLRQPRSVG